MKLIHAVRAFLLAALLVTTSYAQTATCSSSTCTVPVGSSYTIAADHDGVDTTEYWLYINGVLTETKPVSALQAGVIAFLRPAAVTGTYVVYLEAVGPEGRAASTTTTVMVPTLVAPPTAPLNQRIILQVEAPPPPPPPAGDSEAYFIERVQRSDCFRAYSLRPDPTQTTPSVFVRGTANCATAFFADQLQNHARVSYSPATDTHPEKQNAAKVAIPVWSDNGVTLSEALDATTTVITFVGSLSSDTRKSYKIDNEIVTGVSKSGNTVTVSRGQFGTTPASHSGGATALVNTNSLGSLRLDTRTDGRVSSTYVLTWEHFYTNDYLKTGLINHKLYQIASVKDGQQWVEFQSRYGGPPSCCPQPLWNIDTDVAVVTSRFYAQSTSPNFVMDPGQPMATAPFSMKPGRWINFVAVIEANAETDHAKFVGVTTLAANVDSTSTVLSMVYPFTSNPLSASIYTAGRAIRIGSEIMTAVSGPTTGEPRPITVLRGQQGTTATAHSANEVVEIIEDYVTLYAIDIDGVVKLYDRLALHIPLNEPGYVDAPGSLSQLWLEFNTSTAELPMGRATGPDGVLGTADDFSPMTAYVRHFTMHKDVTDVSWFLRLPQ